MRKEEVFKEVKKEGKDNIPFFLSRSLCRTVALISFTFTPSDVCLERIGQTKVYKKFDETDTRNHWPLFSVLNVSGKINESWVNDVIMDHEINTNHQVNKWRSTRKKLLEHEKKNREKHSTASRVSLLNNLSQLLKI